MTKTFTTYKPIISLPEMSVIKIKKGLDLPIQGTPQQIIPQGNTNSVRQVALLGDDYPGLKPTMAVQEGDLVKTGQLLFTDKTTQGLRFTSPGCGKIAAIERGPKRRFEAIIITLDGDDKIKFQGLDNRQATDLTPEEIRSTLIESGLWTAIRSRPYGKTPAVDAHANALFITAIDTLPLAADPELIIAKYSDDFQLGVQILDALTPKTTVCIAQGQIDPAQDLPAIHSQEFSGPHPAGLPSTHIHFLDPVHSSKTVWHINYQDVIAVGHLFRTGYLTTKRIISLAGPSTKRPRLITTRLGANITEICQNEITTTEACLISGSVLSGRRAEKTVNFLGRYHLQINAIQDNAGRGLFSWLRPGMDKFSITGLFLSHFIPTKTFSMPTATWGGHRAIFPLGTYERVMPLDIIATALLKSLSNNDTENAQELGCLELIEEDLALCAFVCPGKNNFGTMLRTVLTQIETEG